MGVPRLRQDKSTAAKNFLVPSVPLSRTDMLKELAKFFAEIELNLASSSTALNKKSSDKLVVCRDEIKQAGVSIYSVHLPLFDISRDEHINGIINYVIFAARLFSPQVLVLHPGRGNMVSLVKNVAAIASELPEGTIITVENMTSSKALISSPETAKAFAGMTTGISNAGICIDFTHPWFESETITVDRYTRLLIDYIESSGLKLGHLHFSDRKKGVETHSLKHLQLGGGLINWRLIRTYLENSVYAGKAVLEIKKPEKAEAIISSACHYYDIEPKDLKIREDNDDMVEKKITKEEFFAKLRKRIDLPEKMIPRFGIPSEGLLDESDDHLYFFVPSTSYKGKHEHIDPHYSLTGAEEGVGWAKYLFGVRDDADRLNAILIDRSKKIAVEETIADIYDKNAGWGRFEKSINEALRRTHQERLDHVEVVLDGVSFVFKGDEKAWGST